MQNAAWMSGDRTGTSTVIERRPGEALNEKEVVGSAK